MTALALSLCDRPLDATGGPPEWVHLLPAGRSVAGRDGRAWSLPDPAALVAAFKAKGIDLPIDFEHANDRPEVRATGRPIPAAGWIKALALRADGLWGRVEWTETAREMIGRKEYRFLSPSFLYTPKTRTIVALKGAGLVHNPNLALTALASEDPPMLPDTPTNRDPATDGAPDFAQAMTELLGIAPSFAEAIAILLGVPPATAPAELVSLIAQRIAKGTAAPDPKRFVPVETLAEVLADRNRALAAQGLAQAAVKVDAALARGQIATGMRAWALGLCRSDEAAFDEFLARTPPIYGHLTRAIIPAGPPPAGHGRAASAGENEAAICAQLGLKPGTLVD